MTARHAAHRQIADSIVRVARPDLIWSTSPGGELQAAPVARNRRIRVSLAGYNDEQDIDALARVLIWTNRAEPRLRSKQNQTPALGYEALAGRRYPIEPHEEPQRGS